MSIEQDESVRERLEDFFQDFSEAHQRCEHILIALEQAGTGNDNLSVLADFIVTAKANLLYAGLKEITPILQALEGVIDGLRKGSLAYDATLSDVLLMGFDKVHTLVEHAVKTPGDFSLPGNLPALCDALAGITAASSHMRADAIQKALMCMDPALSLNGPAAVNHAKPHSAPLLSDADDVETILAFHGVSLDEDLRFFMALNAPLEARSHYWQGRTARQLNLALAMNNVAGQPVAPDQLAVAVMLHDAGMAFLPVEILHADSPLQHDAIELLQGHPTRACTLMSSLKRWETAAAAILQHHERVDGTGYLQRLSREAICDGAKILAIVDTFEARTHERAHTHMTKRPFIRAILEINSCAGTQFDTRWVEHFNKVARDLTAKNAR